MSYTQVPYFVVPSYDPYMQQKQMPMWPQPHMGVWQPPQNLFYMNEMQQSGQQQTFVPLYSFAPNYTHVQREHGMAARNMPSVVMAPSSSAPSAATASPQTVMFGTVPARGVPPIQFSQSGVAASDKPGKTSKVDKKPEDDSHEAEVEISDNGSTAMKIRYALNGATKVGARMRALGSEANAESLMIISKTQPPQCKVCKQTFRTKWTLKKHIRRHTGEKPHFCEKCNQGFTQRGSWNRHVFMAHGNEVDTMLNHTMHRCPYCPKCYRKPENLYKHLETHKRTESDDTTASPVKIETPSVSDQALKTFAFIESGKSSAAESSRGGSIDSVQSENFSMLTKAAEELEASSEEKY